MNKAPVYGIDKEIQARLAAKIDPERIEQAQAWIEELTGAKFDAGFQETLKSGIVLCNTVNAIKPGAVRRVSKMSAPFKQMENIEKYLKACRKLGMKENDCFETIALYENTNIVAVIDQIFALGALSRNVAGFEGPHLGIKFAKENRRSFSAATLAKGKAQLSLQTRGSYGFQDETKNARLDAIDKSAGIKSVGGAEISKQAMGSIAVDKGSRLDAINRGKDTGAGTSGATLLNQGSIAVDKGARLDAINRGATTGAGSSGQTRFGQGAIAVKKNARLDAIDKSAGMQSVGGSEISKQALGSIAVDKGARLDAINRGATTGAGSSGQTRFGQGAIAVEKNARLDAIDKSAGMHSVGGSEISKQALGSIAVDKGARLDAINRGATTGAGTGGATLLNQGSIAVDKGARLDAINRGATTGAGSSGQTRFGQGAIAVEKNARLDNIDRSLDQKGSSAPSRINEGSYGYQPEKEKRLDKINRSMQQVKVSETGSGFPFGTKFNPNNGQKIPKFDPNNGKQNW